MTTTPNTNTNLPDACPCSDISDGHCLDCGKQVPPPIPKDIDDPNESAKSEVLLPRDQVPRPCYKCGGIEFWKKSKRCVDCNKKVPPHPPKEVPIKKSTFKSYVKHRYYEPGNPNIFYICQNCRQGKGCYRSICSNCGKRIYPMRFKSVSEEERKENVKVIDEIFNKYRPD